MSYDTIKGHWKELAPSIRQQWEKLTEADLTVRAGTSAYLTQKVEQRYGVGHADALKQVRAFEQEIQDRRNHAAARKH